MQLPRRSHWTRAYNRQICCCYVRPDERSIPGNTIAVHAEMPFSGLTTFGGAVLSKFECSQMPHPLLDQITFVDTPGVLSGEKQRTQELWFHWCNIMGCSKM